MCESLESGCPRDVRPDCGVLRSGARKALGQRARLHRRPSRGRPKKADVEIPWRLPDGTTIPRPYHLFQEGELERLIIESGLRGERFFRSAGNWFALARADG